MSDRAAIDRLLSDATAKGEIAGVVAVAGSAGGEIYAGAAGRRDLAKPDPMTVDTVFWIASMTKAIVSAAAMQMVEQGKVGLEQDLGGILPELANRPVLEGWDAEGKPRLRPAKGAITLRQLLTHTAGLCYEIWNADIARYQEHAGIPSITTCENKALTTPLVADPGTQWNYGINIDFAGKLVEKLSGQRLDAYLQDHLFAPLGMHDTGFKLRPDQRSRLAAMHARSPDDGKLAPIPFEMPQEPEFHMGGGGLYSTAADYLAFCRMILNRGSLNGATVLRPETVTLMGQNHMGDINVTKLVTVASAASYDAEFFPGMVKKWGLGFMLSTEAVPSGRSANSLTWAGLGNTYFWIDPASDVAGVILTQSLPFADPAVLRLYEAFETEVYRAAGERQAA
ncbi:MAG TPA: serine hydrolase domain-containing protein [Acetobacteraceae bacterium]|nr:serine hydrolase domain-containing protein [Acetobacteraceae bacterium]